MLSNSKFSDVAPKENNNASRHTHAKVFFMESTPFKIPIFYAYYNTSFLYCKYYIFILRTYAKRIAKHPAIPPGVCASLGW